jgi:response regulator RpfG family c-di-GMP phosphodiesterase
VNAETSHERARVLVVDDDATLGEMIVELLRDKGHEALYCATPEESLERAGHMALDVAVVDLVMPGMGGIELADRIKDVQPDAQVLILTGHADMQSAIAGLQHGIFDYLQKSTIDIPRLERVVREAGHRARLLRQNRELLERLREGNRLLTTLHDTTARISAETHLDRLLTELVASAKKLCNAESGRVLLVDTAGEDRIVIEQAIGDETATLPGVRLLLTEGIATRAFTHDTAELSSDPGQDPRFSDRVDALPTERPGLICAPLRHGLVRGILMVGGRVTGVFGPADRDVLAVLARHAAVAVDNALEHERSINFFTHTSNILVGFLENFDVFYPGHSRGVARLVDMITRRMGLPDTERRNMHFAALLHDIGKLLVPAEVLQAADHASPKDRELLRSHPALAFDLLKPITMWEEILPMIHSHHERWDGGGYPLGTAGETIPLGGRVIAVADAFDAMTRRRPHGPVRTHKEALAELEACSGTQFDPKVVRLFVAEYWQNQEAEA